MIIMLSGWHEKNVEIIQSIKIKIGAIRIAFVNIKSKEI